MSATTSASAPHDTLVIRPPSRWTSLGLRELWRFRELLFFLTWRDVKVRYKQTVLGAAWALLQPFLTMMVFTLVFHRFGKIGTGSIPYPLFSLTGLSLWFYFTNSVNTSSASLVASAPLITKVYFPRLAVTITPLLAGLVDLVLTWVLVGGTMAYYGYGPGWHLALLPIFVVLAVLNAFGIGLLLSALNVKYRDVRYVVPFFMQIWMYASPVAYPSSLVHGTYAKIYALNPMTGIIEGYRWAILGGDPPRVSTLAISLASGIVLMLLGAVYFSRTERGFADVI